MGVPQCTRQQFGGSQSELNCLSGNYVECRCPGTFVNLRPENLKMYQYKLIIISRRVNISGVEGNCPFSSFSLELPKGYWSWGISIKVFKILPCKFKLILKTREEEKRKKPTRPVCPIKYDKFSSRTYFSLFKFKTKYIRMVNILSAFWKLENQISSAGEFVIFDLKSTDFSLLCFISTWTYTM